MSATVKKLPDRWTEYGAIGSRVLGTRFIAFKVPLKKVYESQLAPWQKFSVSDLFSEIQRQNQELGLIVDLTCTNRYYTQGELPATVKYAKIAIAGKQVPTEEVFTEFVSTVRRFLNENSSNDKLIGVHCTHGLNRTGYLVCRFMISVLGMAPAKAIEKFNQSRGHDIDQQNYLDDLLRRVPRHIVEPARSVLPTAGVQAYGVSADFDPNFRPTVCLQDRLWFAGLQWANQSWGPQITPQYPQLSGLHIPELQHRLQWMGGGPPGSACVNGAPGIPSPAFPYIPAPRQWLPHTADLHQQHFRGGPQNFAAHPPIPITWPQHYGPVNGARAWTPMPYGGDTTVRADTRASGPRLHGQNTPYSRAPAQDRQGTPRHQRQ